MQQWRIETPTSLEVEGVTRLEVRLVGGRIHVVGGVEASGAPQDVVPRQAFVEHAAPAALQDVAPTQTFTEPAAPTQTFTEPAGPTQTFTEPAAPYASTIDAPAASGPLEGQPAGRIAGGRARIEVTRLEGPLTVTLADGSLMISHERLTWAGILEWFGGRRTKADVSVSVPTNCPVRIGVVDAEAVVSGIDADTTAVKSVSGDVTLDGVRSGIVARTVSGDLETRRLAGDLEFSTVSGDLTVVQGTTSRLRAESVSGDLTLDLDLAPGGRLDVKTISGDLTLRLPGDAGLVVQVTTTSGSLDSAFGGVATLKKPGQGTMSGQIGSGAGLLKAKSVSGDVTLLARSS